MKFQMTNKKKSKESKHWLRMISKAVPPDIYEII